MRSTQRFWTITRAHRALTPPTCRSRALATLLGALSALAVGCGGGGGGGSGGSGGSTTLADLVVDLVAFDPPAAVAGASLSISDTISNHGARAADDVRVGLYLSTDATITSADKLLGFRTIARLEPGQSSSGGGALTLPVATAAGTYWIGALADDVSAVAESSETNNARASALSIVVSAAPLPDLELTAVSVAQTAALAGGLVDVSDSVKNAGVAAAGAFQVGIYLSSDATITAQDLLLGLRPVASLAPGATSSGGDSLTVPPTISAGIWWLGALADPQGSLAESDESDNARTAGTPLSISVPPRPNLVVQSFSFSPVSADTGTPITVADTIANIGPGAAGSFDIGVYLSTDAVITRDDVRIATRTLAALASGASDSSMGDIVLPVELAGGSYHVGAIVDVGLELPESSEADNALAASGVLSVTIPPRPDLAPSAVSFSPGVVDTTLSQVVHVSETVTNFGTAPAVPFRVGIYLSSNNVITPSDVLLASRVVGTLPVNASSGALTDVGIPLGVSPGTYFLGVVVDDLGAQLELGEANNALAAPGSIDVIASPLPLPDLVVQSVSYTPHDVNPGGVIQVLNEVRNQGLLSATSFQLGIYLSDDDVISTDDRRIGQRTVLQLGINFGSASSAPFVVPANVPAGTYYVGAIADDLSHVAENVEVNNTLRASGTLAVVIPPPPMPDLVVDVASFTPESPAAGAMVQLSATVRNQGDLAAGAFRVAFYAASDGTVDAQDTLLGFQTLGALAPGASFVGTISVGLPAGFAAGSYKLGAIVDDAQLVDEGVETNNVFTAAALLQAP